MSLLKNHLFKPKKLILKAKHIRPPYSTVGGSLTYLPVPQGIPRGINRNHISAVPILSPHTENAMATMKVT